MIADAPREFVNRPNRFRSPGAFRDALRELANSRDAVWQLIWRDVASRYRQSFLGLGWAILTPLALVLVFVYLRGVDVVNGGPTNVPYPLFLYTGLLSWQLMQGAVSRMTGCLVANPTLVTRVRFPREIVVLASMGGAIFDFVLGTIVLAGFFVWYGVTPEWTMLFAPLLLAVQMAFALSLGLVLSVLNGALRDIANMVPLGMTLWMFLTPVLYPRGAPWMDWLNPMSPFLVAFRDLAFTGQLTMVGPLIAAVVVTAVALPLSWRLFHVMLPRVAETI